MRRAPRSGEARNVELPTSQRVTLVPRYGTVSMAVVLRREAGIMQSVFHREITVLGLPCRSARGIRGRILRSLQGAALASCQLTNKPSSPMFRTIIKALMFLMLAGIAGSSARAANEPTPLPKTKKVSVIVIPVREEI